MNKINFFNDFSKNRSLSFNQLKSERQFCFDSYRSVCMILILTVQHKLTVSHVTSKSVKQPNTAAYMSSIYEGCTQMWGFIKTPVRLLKCYAVFEVLAQLSTFPELLPLTKPGLLANKLNRPTQGLFSSAE